MVKKTEPGTVIVNTVEFSRTRDSVIVALATLQQSVQELSRAYINHANTVLGPGQGGAINEELTNVLTGSGLLGGLPGIQSQAPVDQEEGGKKKRKRAPHDPNAPKRALTPYFLYMSHARAQIKKELPESATPKEVADEGTRRWGAMSASEKQVWEDQYAKNLAAYRIRTTAYKAGAPVPSEEEAMRIVEAGGADAYLPTTDAAEASEEEVVAPPAPVAPEESSSSSSDEEEAAPEPEPEPEPEPPKSKRRKSEKKEKATSAEETPAAKETPKPKKEKKAAKKEPTPPPPTSATKTASGGRKKSSRAK